MSFAQLDRSKQVDRALGLGAIADPGERRTRLQMLARQRRQRPPAAPADAEPPAAPAEQESDTGYTPTFGKPPPGVTSATDPAKGVVDMFADAAGTIGVLWDRYVDREAESRGEAAAGAWREGLGEQAAKAWAGAKEAFTAAFVDEARHTQEVVEEMDVLGEGPDALAEDMAAALPWDRGVEPPKPERRRTMRPAGPRRKDARGAQRPEGGPPRTDATGALRQPRPDLQAVLAQVQHGQAAAPAVLRARAAAGKPPVSAVQGGDRSPRTLGVDTGNPFQRLEAGIRRKVPETASPTTGRIVGRIGAEIAVLVAAIPAGAKAGAEFVGGFTLGAIRSPDRDIGITWDSFESPDAFPLLSAIAHREGDSPLVRTFKNGLEEGLIAAGSERLLRGSLKLVQHRKAVAAKLRGALGGLDMGEEGAPGLREMAGGLGGVRVRPERAAGAPKAAPKPEDAPPGIGSQEPTPDAGRPQRPEATEPATAASAVASLRRGLVAAQDATRADVAELDDLPDEYIGGLGDDYLAVNFELDSAQIAAIRTPGGPGYGEALGAARANAQAAERELAADVAKLDDTPEEALLEYDDDTLAAFDVRPEEVKALRADLAEKAIARAAVRAEAEAATAPVAEAASLTPQADAAARTPEPDEPVHTLAEDPDPAAAPRPYEQPLEAWPEADRAAMDEAAGEMGVRVEATPDGAAAVRTEEGLHPVVGEADGRPVVTRRPLGEGEPSPLAVRKERSEALAEGTGSAGEGAGATPRARDPESAVLRRINRAVEDERVAQETGDATMLAVARADQAAAREELAAMVDEPRNLKRTDADGKAAPERKDGREGGGTAERQPDQATDGAGEGPAYRIEPPTPREEALAAIPEQHEAYRRMLEQNPWAYTDEQMRGIGLGASQIRAIRDNTPPLYRVRRADGELARLGGEDLAVVGVRTTPHVLKGVQGHPANLNGVLPAGSWGEAPLNVDRSTMGSSPEDYMLSRENVQAMGLRPEEVKLIAAQHAEASVPEGPAGAALSPEAKAKLDALVRREDETGWQPTGVEGLRRRVKEVAEDLGEKAPRNRKGKGVPEAMDTRALRRMAGGAVRDGLTAAEKRAWVQILNHQLNTVAAAARGIARAQGSGAPAPELVWAAVQAVEELRGMRAMLRGDLDEAERSLRSVWGISRDARTGLPDEALIRNRVQQLYSNGWGNGWRAAVEGLSALARHTDVGALSEAVSHIGGPGRITRALQWWQKVGIAGMLSNPKTAALATTGNAIMTVDQIATTWIGAAIRGVFRSDAELITARSAWAETAARATSLRAALLHAAASAETGLTGGQRFAELLGKESRLKLHRMLDRSNRWDMNDLATQGAPDAARTMGQAAALWTDRAVSSSLTALHGVDMGWKASQAYAYLAGRAAREAAAQRLTGAEYDAFVRQSLDRVPDDWIEDAVRSAEDLTFTRPWTEDEQWLFGVKMAKVIRGVDAVPPVGRLMGMPFMTVPTRALSTALERLPGAGLLMRNVVRDVEGNWVQRRGYQVLAGGGRDAQMVAARQLWGTALMGGAIMGAMSGRVTGGGVPGHSQTDRPEYSFWTGDGWVAYDRLDPIGRIMGVSADIAEALSFAEDGPSVHGASDIAAMAWHSILSHIGDSSWLGSASELITLGSDVLDGDVGSGGAIGKYMGRASGNFIPFSALARGGDRGFSPVYRDTRRVREEGEMWHDAFWGGYVPAFKAGIPGLSNDLPPRIDAYGEPVYRLTPTWGEGAEPQGLGWSLLSPVAYHEDKADRGYRLMRAARWTPPPWPKSSGGVPYTAHERERLARIAGPIFKASLARHAASGALDGYMRAIEAGGADVETAETMMAAEISALYTSALSQGRQAFHAFASDWQAARYQRREAMARERMAVRDYEQVREATGGQ